MICAIHQPNFFPWLGYFDKIRQADIFVFLDRVAYAKSGNGMGCWGNRVQIDIRGQPSWFGCPVHRAPGPQPICDIRIDDGKPWRRKLLRTLEVNYKRAPGFAETIGLVQPLIECDGDNLAELNERAIRRIAGALGLGCRFVRQSELPVAGKATQLLVEIVEAVGATAYLAGGGAAGYQQDGLFAEHGIELLSQGFVPSPYRPAASFLPGLSVIDYLMWGRGG